MIAGFQATPGLDLFFRLEYATGEEICSTIEDGLLLMKQHADNIESMDSQCQSHYENLPGKKNKSYYFLLTAKIKECKVLRKGMFLREILGLINDIL